MVDLGITLFPGINCLDSPNIYTTAELCWFYSFIQTFKTIKKFISSTYLIRHINIKLSGEAIKSRLMLIFC